MTSKLTFSALTNSMSLEIKMTNIMSFYEDMASCIALNSKSNNLEIIAIDKDCDKECQNNPAVKNIVKFTKPLQRSDDIVDYLIERERLQSVKLSINV